MSLPPPSPPMGTTMTASSLENSLLRFSCSLLGRIVVSLYASRSVGPRRMCCRQHKDDRNDVIFVCCIELKFIPCECKIYNLIGKKNCEIAFLYTWFIIYVQTCLPKGDVMRKTMVRIPFKQTPAVGIIISP